MTPPSGGSRRVPDIRYGDVPGYRPLELDLYLPGTGEPAPVIVHVHGGGWRRGSRREPLRALGEDFYDTLAAQGFAVAAVDYRLSAEARFPAPLEDVTGAVGWVRDNAARYGLDDGRVFLWGDSAGMPSRSVTGNQATTPCTLPPVSAASRARWPPAESPHRNTRLASSP